MATLDEAEAHRSLVDDVVTLAVAQLVAEWPSLPEDPLKLRGQLGDLLVALVTDFGDMAAAVGADFYESQRMAAGAPGRFVAVQAPTAPVDQVTASAEWAASGAWADRRKALGDAASVADRLIAEADRATIALNVDEDPAAPRYARYASANACAFCAMNALRGPVYRGEDTAGDKYHAHCRCIAVPVWNVDDYQEAPYVADWREAYHSATETLGGANDLKAILALMRQSTGLR